MILNETVRGGQSMSVAWPNFQDWRDQSEVFEHFGLYRSMTLNLTGGDQPERLNGSLASSEVGRTMLLNGEPHVIVGIAPPGMRFPSRLTDVWLPLGLFVDTFPSDRGAHPGSTRLVSSSSAVWP